MVKVLVVDDEKTIRDALQEFLTDEGNEVTTADNGQSGLDKFNSGHYDIVFMDVKMPGIDGIETIHQMKMQKSETKFIIITGIPDEATFDRAVSVIPGSVDAFLAKPFKPSDIRDCLKKISSGEKLPSFGLNPKQVEVLNQLGNNCASNATVAFKQVLQREIKIALQNIDIVPLQEFVKLYKDDVSYQTELTTKCLGDIAGKIVVLVAWDNGLKLIDVLEKRPVGVSKTYDERIQGMLKAVGNILSGAYLNAIAKLLGVSTQSSMPELNFKKKNEVFPALVKEFSSKVTEVEYFFVIQAMLTIVDANINCEVLLIPEIGSLKKILHILGALEK